MSSSTEGTALVQASPAFAVDENHRIVFWNKGAERVLGWSVREALGQHCYDLLSGRDLFGNRFCQPCCAVLSTLRRREVVHAFEIEVAAPPTSVRWFSVRIHAVPGSPSGAFTAVHVLQPVAESSRLVRPVSRLGSTETAGCPPLTARERQVLAWMASGLLNKEVAQRLSISLATVRNHVHSILCKLGVHSKLAAVALILRRGWKRKNPARWPAASRRQARGGSALH